MLSTIVAVAGVLCGIAGVALGGFAYLRSRMAVEDCRAIVQRLLPDANGIDARAVRDVAVVRYDALEEMSGARSFSLALLNAAGDGVVVTSINGRTESRTYAKAVEGGNATEVLSPEEYRAVRAARLGHSPESRSPVGGEKGKRPAPGPLTPPVQAAEPAGGSTEPKVSVVPARSADARESADPEPAGGAAAAGDDVGSGFPAPGDGVAEDIDDPGYPVEDAAGADDDGGSGSGDGSPYDRESSRAAKG